MITPDALGLRLLGAIFAAVFVAQIARMIAHPTPKLASRVRPYTATSRSTLGRIPDRSQVTTLSTSIVPQGLLQRLSRPFVDSVTNGILKTFGGIFNDESLSTKLRHSGVLSHIPESDRVHEYRVRQVGSGLGFAVLSGLAAAVVGMSPAACLGMFALGALTGVARRSAGVSRRIDKKRERMRIELYTINQLLAIYLRTSGSPILAAQRLVRRGRGAVIDELDEALRLHARGVSATKAFTRLAEQTPEPFAARTYKLLAGGSERGADLANALLALSDDIRDYRRTTVRRSATKRQATMLLPIIALLAPVMLLFIAAPLPSMIFKATS